MRSQGLNPKGLYAAFGEQYQRPSITPDFIERQGIWEKIVTHFNKSDQQILTLSAQGLGGMGKTEMAKYYYLNPPRPYTIRAWFNAEDRDLLYLQYIDLAKANGIEYEKRMPIEEQAKLIKSWLEGQKDCFLVYDNALGARELEGLLPEQGKHHILITSRNSVGWSDHQRLDIDVMEEQEAIALICKITGCQKDTPEIKELVKTLNCLPLALAQAGAYIVEKVTSITDYLELYRKYQSVLMSDEAFKKKPKHEPVWVTFNMNFKALEDTCPSALPTLKQASWLSSSAIPEMLLKYMVQNTTNRSVDLLWGDMKGHISRYSLMRIDREGHQLSMHQLLQDILRSKQDELASKEILKQIALTIPCIYPRNDNMMKDIHMRRLLLLHIETILLHIKNNFNTNECPDFNLEFYLGNAYSTIGNYVKAKENFYKDLLIKQEKYYKDGPIRTGGNMY
ncbi:MAG: hypothetical protein ACK4M7_08230, partial [Burkholderiales bacterium]